MKRTYIRPSVGVLNMNATDKYMLTMSINETTVTSDQQLGREEEDFTSGTWDAEW